MYSSLLVFVLWVLIQNKCLSCDLIKNMTVLWLIIGLGQWFLTFFYIPDPFIKQDHQIYPNTLNGAHLLKI